MTREGYPEGYIGQHTLFDRRVMQLEPKSKKWREHPGMLVIMPEVDEKALHRELPSLPLPSKKLATRALQHLNSLPPDFGRLEMFRSVTSLMHDLHDRYPDTWLGAEARTFAEHFQNQQIFFGRALTKEDEEEILLIRELAKSMGNYALTGFEAEPVVFRSGFVEEKKWGRNENQPSEDCILVDDQRGIYGVFDGLGGMEGRPDKAARAARDAIAYSLSEASPPASYDDMELTMRRAFNTARQDVMDWGGGGSTTATVAWHTSFDGKDYWVFGNAGDSRSFLYDKSKKTYQPVTSNQGYGRIVTNAFEPAPDGRYSMKDEFVVVPADSTMRLMLCSDGITGDTADEALTENEFLTAFAQESPYLAAFAFHDFSVKIDDKSVIVVDFAKE